MYFNIKGCKLYIRTEYKMKISPVNINSINGIQNCKKDNKNTNFKQMKIFYPKEWDKDVLQAVKENDNLKEFEEYLEKNNSVLELFCHNTKLKTYDGVDEFELSCVYDRHNTPSGERKVLIGSAPKNIILGLLERFDAAKMIEEIEAERGHLGQAKPVEKEQKPNFWQKIFDNIAEFFA